MSRMVSRNTAQHVAQRCSCNFETYPIVFSICQNPLIINFSSIRAVFTELFRCRASCRATLRNMLRNVAATTLKSPILFPVCVYLSTRGSQLCISTVPGDISNCPVFFRKKKEMEKKREKSLSTLPRCVPGRRGVPVRPPGCPYLLVYWTDFKNKKTKWGVYGGSESIDNTHFTVRTRKTFLTQF